MSCSHELIAHLSSHLIISKVATEHILRFHSPRDDDNNSAKSQTLGRNSYPNLPWNFTRVLGYFSRGCLDMRSWMLVSYETLVIHCQSKNLTNFDCQNKDLKRSFKYF